MKAGDKCKYYTPISCAECVAKNEDVTDNECIDCMRKRAIKGKVIDIVRCNAYNPKAKKCIIEVNKTKEIVEIPLDQVHDLDYTANMQCAPSVQNGATRCRAYSKRTGCRCKNPAVRDREVCRMHYGGNINQGTTGAELS